VRFTAAIGYVDVGFDESTEPEIRYRLIGDRPRTRVEGAPPGERAHSKLWQCERGRDVGPGKIQPVAHGEHLVAAGLGPPQVLHRREPFGVFGGDVMRLREVVLEVEQPPPVVVDLVTAIDRGALLGDTLHDAIGGGLPPVAVDGP